MNRSAKYFVRHVLILAAAAIVVASCGREPPTGVQRPNASLLGGLLGDGDSQGQNEQDVLLSCAPLPAASATALIGPSGGTLTVGPHTFTVPAGALSAPVQITAAAPSSTSRYIQFSPQGLQFSTPASLTMSFAHCALLTELLPSIAYTDNALDILSYIPSVANLFTQTVTGQVRHFSGYAVAY